MSAWQEYKKKNPDYENPTVNKTHNSDSIFVAIPAFEEEDLYETVEDCFKKAANPAKIFIGIANQKIGTNFEDFSGFPNVRVVNTSSKFALGLGLSFTIAMALYDYQEFFLRIDAHSRFEQDWDSILIKNYNIIKDDGYEKPIISYRIPCFEKKADGSLKFNDFSGPHVQGLKNELINITLPRTDGQTTLIEEDTHIEELWKTIIYKEHYFISGHFIFASGSFVKDVFADPRIVFFGEEHTIAMRAHGNGYRMFAIGEQSVMTMGKTEQYFENIGSNNGKYIHGSLTFLHQNFSHHYKLILRGKELGYFGAKDEKAYMEYAQAMGIDYGDIL